MMAVHYRGEPVVFIGATQYGLVAELVHLPSDDVDRRRVTAVCEWALEMRRHTGCEPGRLPHERRGDEGGTRRRRPPPEDCTP
jgi:hypothetical protein